jgi:hypothetical protein
MSIEAFSGGIKRDFFAVNTVVEQLAGSADYVLISGKYILHPFEKAIVRDEVVVEKHDDVRPAGQVFKCPVALPAETLLRQDDVGVGPYRGGHVDIFSAGRRDNDTVGRPGLIRQSFDNPSEECGATDSSKDHVYAHVSRFLVMSRVM